MVAAVRYGTLRRVPFHDTGQAPVPVSEDFIDANASSPAGSVRGPSAVMIAAAQPSIMR